MRGIPVFYGIICHSVGIMKRASRISFRLWTFFLGLAAGIALTVGFLELPYLNFHPVIPPVEAHPLVVRHDAKGDGRFEAPRSGNRRHRGIDFAAPLDSPVRAIRSGTVLEVGFHKGLGRFVEVEHERNLRSLYAHLNTVTVEAGERIKQGKVIGTIGKTGNARHPWIIPHLHLEVWEDGTPIDPLSLGLEVQGVEVDSSTEESDARGIVSPSPDMSKRWDD